MCDPRNQRIQHILPPLPRDTRLWDALIHQVQRPVPILRLENNRMRQRRIERAQVQAQAEAQAEVNDLEEMQS